MTREKKIEALVKKEYFLGEGSKEIFDSDMNMQHFKEGILAGIALRDAELLEKLGTFDEQSSHDESFRFDDRDAQCGFEHGAKWQYEQFMNKLKENFRECSGCEYGGSHTCGVTEK